MLVPQSAGSLWQLLHGVSCSTTPSAAMRPAQRVDLALEVLEGDETGVAEMAWRNGLEGYVWLMVVNGGMIYLWWLMYG